MHNDLDLDIDLACGNKSRDLFIKTPNIEHVTGMMIKWFIFS